MRVPGRGTFDALAVESQDIAVVEPADEIPARRIDDRKTGRAAANELGERLFEGLARSQRGRLLSGVAGDDVSGVVPQVLLHFASDDGAAISSFGIHDRQRVDVLVGEPGDDLVERAVVSNRLGHRLHGLADRQELHEIALCVP